MKRFLVVTLFLVMCLSLVGCSGLPLTDSGNELVNGTIVNCTGLEVGCAGGQAADCKECLENELDVLSKLIDDPNKTYVKSWKDQDYIDQLEKIQIIMATLYVKGETDPTAHSQGCSEGLNTLRNIQKANAGTK